jgi:exoribonuclease-2
MIPVFRIYFFVPIIKNCKFMKEIKTVFMDLNSNRSILQKIARKAMIERGLLPDFPSSVDAELAKITNSPVNKNSLVKDLRDKLWCSIDNTESRDLDQLSCAEQLPENKVRVYVAIADVDALVAEQSQIDNHASLNTTSVYTVAAIFPMLPEKLSTDLTSLSFGTDRCAVVVDMVINEEGSVEMSDVYSAIVHNYAKLDYNSVGLWLEGAGPIPSGIASVAGLAENIKLQDHVAQKMKELRYTHGALDFETIESFPVFDGETLREMKVDKKNRAKDLIADFMIATNGVTAIFLTEKNFPSIRRVVHVPKQWDRIAELASEHGYNLPAEADSKSLSEYLKFFRQNDPQHYADMSLSVLKLLGGGEYVMEMPGTGSEGHFGLAVKDYAHSTAPNRRFPDLVTQRLLKCAISGQPVPYQTEQLRQIAFHCTQKEDDVKKVERQVEKAANAILLESRIGEIFDAIVTGASPKGTWIRISHPNVEGKLIKGYQNLKVGQKLKVRLVQINVEEGFIDFVPSASTPTPPGVH